MKKWNDLNEILGREEIIILRPGSRDILNMCKLGKRVKEIQNSFYGSNIYHSYAVSPQFITTRNEKKE